MTEISTYLFEKKTLLREGLKSFLANTSFKVTGEYRQLTEIIDDSVCDIPPELLIIGVERQDFLIMEDQYQFSDQIDSVKQLFPAARIVIMMPQEDLARASLLFRCHADSYIPSDLSPEALISYLNLAMIGEKIMPAHAAMMMTVQDNAKQAGNIEPLLPERHLSERESDIIECLMHGKSNKLIAKDLSITESTVKVHLKTILRKLGVRNRTQAAMWAVRHGFPGRSQEQELLSVA